MLTPNLQGNSQTPLYEQLYIYIKEEIEKGHLKTGDKLPSKRTLAAHLNIAINTITTAYEQLVDEGYIKSYERKGYFVENLDGTFISTKDPVFSSELEEDNKVYRFDFSFNKVDYQGFPYVTWGKLAKNVMARKNNDLINYMDPQGSIFLRREIANYLRDARGLTISPSRIIISSGTEYLFQIIFALLPEKDIFGVENPGYERINGMFQGSNRKCVPISLDESGMKVDQLEKSKAKVASVTPSHQFPTGVIMPLPRRMELLKWASEKEGRYIIEDDYDSEFRYSGKPIPPLKNFDMDDVVIYIGSFSKSVFPGLRISYMVLPGNLMQEFLSRLAFFQCPVSVPTQEVLAKFIAGGYFERHLNRMRKNYKRKREILVQACEKEFPQGKILGEDAGLHLLLELEETWDEGEIIKVLEKGGILVHGLHEYYITEEKNKKPTLVLGFGNLEDMEITRAVAVLADEIQKQRK
ncbi:MAG: PLP-dependent aminotransferase family protein [Tissierellia bacterium]|nr:PLP-dependent aminotransferase family protein [Tissierellia bacterium]